MFDKIINTPAQRRVAKGLRLPGRLIVTPPIDLRLTTEQRLILKQFSDWEKRSARMRRMFDVHV